MKTILAAILLVATVNLTSAGDKRSVKHYVIKVTSGDTTRQVDFRASYLHDGDSHGLTQLQLTKTPFKLDIEAECVYLLVQSETPGAALKEEVFRVDSLGNEIPWGSSTAMNGIAVVIDYDSGCITEDGTIVRRIGLRSRGF